jgi:hypothetical protein
LIPFNQPTNPPNNQNGRSRDSFPAVGSDLREDRRSYVIPFQLPLIPEITYILQFQALSQAPPVSKPPHYSLYSTYIF